VQFAVVMGAVAMEAMPHQKGFGNVTRSPKLVSSSPRSHRKSPGVIFKQPRSHQDLPVRLRRKLTRTSSDEDLSPSPSSKRSHPGGGGRPLKQLKRLEDGELSEYLLRYSVSHFRCRTAQRQRYDANNI
jgi:hypothetical protein